MIAVVVPFTRPKFVANVIENFQRQNFKEKVLIVVENGPGVGGFPRIKTVPAIVTVSDHHRAHARNQGIKTAKTAGIGYWAIMEDDDWYGPQYLQEVWEHRHNGHITGKGSYLLQGPDQSLWNMYPGRENIHFDFLGRGKQSTSLLAATLAGWTEAILPFRPDISYAEELIWYLEMQIAGFTLWSRGSLDFRLIRYSEPDHNHAGDHHWTSELETADAVRVQ
jgi:hypothetical protein